MSKSADVSACPRWPSPAPPPTSLAKTAVACFRSTSACASIIAASFSRCWALSKLAWQRMTAATA
eukprot:3709223-Pyramimonas_sp.AAC.1